MDRNSKFYFRDDGLLLRWSEREQSWIEDYTGSMFVEGVAPKPKGSRLERYLKGVKGAVMAPVHLAKDTAFKVVDMSTQGFAVVGKLTGGWDVGYTTLSSTSQAVEAGVPQSEILWHATGGLVVDPMLAFGDQLVAFGSGNMDLWEFAGNVTGTIMRDTFAGQVGSYLKVKGHHIHQSAAYRKTIGINPNHGEAIAIQQGVPGFTFKDHDLASAAQRNINRGMWDKEVKLDQLRPTPGSDPVLKIGAEGNVAPRMLPSGKLAKSFEPMPSPWFEDIKAFYSLRAAGISPDMAYGLVDRSAKQIATKGILPVRVPTR
jgi:hypothetical protein